MEEAYDWQAGWNNEEYEEYIQTDLALISATLSETLADLADHLQFVWKLAPSGNTLVVKVEEEYDDNGAVMTTTTTTGDGETPFALKEAEYVLSDEDNGEDNNVVAEENDEEREKTRERWDLLRSVVENDSDEEDDDASEEEFMKAIEPPPQKRKSKEFSLALVPALLSASKSKKDEAKQAKQKAKEKEAKNWKMEQVANVVQTLEQDLATNFANERLKALTSKGKCFLYAPIVIAALYLLPRNTSFYAIKKLVYETMVDQKHSTNNALIRAMKTLVKNKLVLQTGGICGKHLLSTEFKKFLQIPVMLHDEVRLAKFKARYALTKMCPIKVCQKRGPKGKLKLKHLQQDNAKQSQTTTALQPRKGDSHLFQEAALENLQPLAIKQEAAFKIEPDAVV